MAVEFNRLYPTIRIFSEEKAKEFYVDFLGCAVDWEHRFEPGSPLFLQIKRGNLVLRLSEHHGDGSPGIHITIDTTDLDAFHKELSDKKYKYMRPGIEQTEWGTRDLSVWDPFGNKLTFSERVE